MLETVINHPITQSLLVTAITAMCGAILAMLKKADRDRKHNAEASRALLYDKLKYLCEKYIAQEGMGIEDCRNLEVLYQAYKDLDGNGFIRRLYLRAMELPIRKEE